MPRPFLALPNSTRKATPFMLVWFKHSFVYPIFEALFVKMCCFASQRPPFAAPVSWAGLGNSQALSGISWSGLDIPWAALSLTWAGFGISWTRGGISWSVAGIYWAALVSRGPGYVLGGSILGAGSGISWAGLGISWIWWDV